MPILDIYVKPFNIYDFDICGTSWRAYDLATLRLSLDSYCQNPENEWKIVLFEYGQAGGQTYSDDLIKDLMVLRQLWVWGWNYTHGEDFRSSNLHSFHHHSNFQIELAKR